MTWRRRRETVIVDATAAGERLDVFLVYALDASRKTVKKALDGGTVFIDGKVERRAGRLLAGSETVIVTLDQPAPPPPTPDLPILFRDDHLLAVGKPSGLPSHPTVAGRPNALDVVIELLRREGRQTPPILLHRLDADTSGVLLFALTAAANRGLSLLFAEREVEKVYLALVAGTPPAVFRVENHLRPGVRGRTVAVTSGGQPAATAFRTLSILLSPRGAEGEGGFSLVEARPETGRTHQIRAHLAGAGFPILGDLVYGGHRQVIVSGTKRLIRRHLLHAFRLTFRHPDTGKKITVEAPLPDDFQEIVSSSGFRVAD